MQRNANHPPRQFLKLPRDAIRQVGPASQTLGAIVYLAGGKPFFRKISDIAELLAISRRTVRKHLEALLEAGYIHHGGRGGRRPVTYRLTDKAREELEYFVPLTLATIRFFPAWSERVLAAEWLRLESLKKADPDEFAVKTLARRLRMCPKTVRAVIDENPTFFVIQGGKKCPLKPHPRRKKGSSGRGNLGHRDGGKRVHLRRRPLELDQSSQSSEETDGLFSPNGDQKKTFAYSKPAHQLAMETVKQLRPNRLRCIGVIAKLCCLVEHGEIPAAVYQAAVSQATDTPKPGGRICGRILDIANIDTGQLLPRVELPDSVPGKLADYVKALNDRRYYRKVQP